MDNVSRVADCIGRIGYELACAFAARPFVTAEDQWHRPAFNGSMGVAMLGEPTEQRLVLWSCPGEWSIADSGLTLWLHLIERLVDSRGNEHWVGLESVRWEDTGLTHDDGTDLWRQHVELLLDDLVTTLRGGKPPLRDRLIGDE